MNTLSAAQACTINVREDLELECVFFGLDALDMDGMNKEVCGTDGTDLIAQYSDVKGKNRADTVLH